MITKQVIYTNSDNQDFIFRERREAKPYALELEIIGGNNRIYFSDLEEAEKFCEILMANARWALIDNQPHKEKHDNI